MTAALALPVLALVAPGREQAADAARRELLRPQYEDARPPLLVRVLARVLEDLGELLSRLSGLPGGRAGLVLLLAVVAALVALLVVRLGPLRRTPPPPALFDGAPVRTADEHRAAADAAAQAGHWPEAVRERLRAVVRDLEQRGVLDPRPGRTAGEVARDGGAALPEVAADLAEGAAVFDDVWYGGRPGGPAAYEVLVRLDGRVRAARAVHR